MSTGMMICSRCRKEVHQDGLVNGKGQRGWRHCARFQGGSEICATGRPITPTKREQIEGAFCQADGPPPMALFG